MNFIFVHSWNGFSLAEWCLRDAVEFSCSSKINFHSVELHSADLEGQEHFFYVLSANQPDLIGFSCCFWNYRYYLELSRAVKQIYPKCKIVLGGAQVNSIPECEEILSTQLSVDYMVRGAGEKPLSLLLESFISSNNVKPIDGLSYRSAGGIVHRPVKKDHSWSREKIFHWKNKALTESLVDQFAVSYETLRGCRYSCSYCQYPFGGVDFLGLNLVVEELTYLCELSIPHIRICDAHFGGTQARAKAILKQLARLKHSSSFKIYADLTHIDSEYLNLIEEAGAEITSIGIQTTNRRTLKLIKRPELHRLEKPIKMILEKFPETPADLIVGLPGDNVESVRKSFADVLNMGFKKFNVFRLSAFPGTPLTENISVLMKDAYLFNDNDQVLDRKSVV